MPQVLREDLLKSQALAHLSVNPKLPAEKRLESSQLLEAHRWEIAKRDPWWFVRNFCITLDEHDSKNPYKRFPNHDYLKFLCYDWEEWSAKMPYWVPKSRQMMVSWLMAALHLWLFVGLEAQLIFFQSKKEEDACRLVDRAWFMAERLPTRVKEDLEMEKSSGKIRSAKRNSLIWGIPQGAAQIRANVPSAVLSDEMAFQEDAELSYVAALPAVEGGGRYTAVSSASPGFFFDVVEDGASAQEKIELARVG